MAGDAEPRVLHNGDGVVIVRKRCLLTLFFYQPGLLAGLEALHPIERQVVAEEGQVAILTVIDPFGTQLTRLPQEVNEKAAALQREFDRVTICHTAIVVGTGVRAVIIRTAVAALYALSPPAENGQWKVFGEDIDEAALWTIERLRAAKRDDIGASDVLASFQNAFAAHDATKGAKPASSGEVVTAVVQQPPAVALVDELPRSFGDYRLEKRIGSGGMADVFLATRKGTGGFEKKLVVKLMHPHLARDPEFVQMFLRESRVAARFSHTNLVQVFDAGAVDGTQYIAMEYVDGLTLQAVARRAWSTGRDVPAALIASACADAARGLHAAHTAMDDQGAGAALVHRDVSPDNIILAKDGTAKVLDFGVAKGGEPSLTASGVVKGKIPFMAPEQLNGADLDGRADLYALGATMYWLLTRERPFRAPDDAALVARVLREAPPDVVAKRPDVPAALASIVTRLLQKDPGARFPDGLALARALNEAVGVDRDEIATLVRAFAAQPDPPREVTDPAGAPTATTSRVPALQRPARTATSTRLIAASIAVGVALVLIALVVALR